MDARRPAQTGWLVRTKISPPLVRDDIVPRRHLLDSLDDATISHPLTLLSAPAGYGKTTLLAQWARSSDLPVAWLSLTEEDGDLERLFRYLLAAWAEVQPGVMESPLGLLLGAMSPDSEAVLSAFINLGDEVPDHLVFVPDDYHLIEDAAIHEALTFLLDRLPPALHFVLAGRVEPPLPLACYRARGEILEFRARDLYFSQDETTDAKTLAPLPDDMRRFLLQTSILDRLCSPLCETVMGVEDGQAMLEHLERENLFLLALDDRREWFRYHRLFADFLREELKRRYPDEVAGLHQRAARWYLAHDLPEPAFRHAVDGSDVELVLRVFGRYTQAKLIGGEFKILKRWLDSLPEAWHSDYPMIGLVRTAFLLFTGQLDAGESRWQPSRSERIGAAIRSPSPAGCTFGWVNCFTSGGERFVKSEIRVRIRACTHVVAGDF